MRFHISDSQMLPRTVYRAGYEAMPSPVPSREEDVENAGGRGRSRFSRFSSIQDNVRSLLFDRGTPAPSSFYSPNPNAVIPDEQPPEMPKPVFRSFLPRRWTNTGARGTAEPQSSSSSVSQLPLNGTAPTTYSPATQPSEWSQSSYSTPPVPQPVPIFRHPNDPLPAAAPAPVFRHPNDPLPSPAAGLDHPDLESGTAPPRRARRHKKKRRRHPAQAGAWVRHRDGRRHVSARRGIQANGRPRIKNVSMMVSGLFLLSILTTYLVIALTVKNLGQELHVLFVLTILGTTVFFCHSLVRLCIASRGHPADPNNPHARARRRQRIPSLTGPEGFQPEVPIRVHLARDEEIAAQNEDGSVEPEKLTAVQHPPPAYGLWRSSVRVNPDLLHWAKIEETPPSPALSTSAGGAQPVQPTSPLAFAFDRGSMLTSLPPINIPSPLASPLPIVSPIAQSPQAQQASQDPAQRRPPSYVSEDGVQYVVEAQPRSTVLFDRPPTEMHPMFRVAPFEPVWRGRR